MHLQFLKRNQSWRSEISYKIFEHYQYLGVAVCPWTMSANEELSSGSTAMEALSRDSVSLPQPST